MADENITSEETEMRIYQHKISIAELLRELTVAAINKPAINMMEDFMYIGFQCGRAGIDIESIKCDRNEFDRRKFAGEL